MGDLGTSDLSLPRIPPPPPHPQIGTSHRGAYQECPLQLEIRTSHGAPRDFWSEVTKNTPLPRPKLELLKKDLGTSVLSPSPKIGTSHEGLCRRDYKLYLPCETVSLIDFGRSRRCASSFKLFSLPKFLFEHLGITISTIPSSLPRLRNPGS